MAIGKNWYSGPPSTSVSGQWATATTTYNPGYWGGNAANTTITEEELRRVWNELQAAQAGINTPRKKEKTAEEKNAEARAQSDIYDYDEEIGF